MTSQSAECVVVEFSLVVSVEKVVIFASNEPSCYSYCCTVYSSVMTGIIVGQNMLIPLFGDR